MSPKLISKFNADLAEIPIGSLFYLFNVELSKFDSKKKRSKNSQGTPEEENSMLVRGQGIRHQRC